MDNTLISIHNLSETDREIILIDLVREANRHAEYGATVALRVRLNLIDKLLACDNVCYKGRSL